MTAADITAIAALITSLGVFVANMARLRQTDEKVKALAIITEKQQQMIEQQSCTIGQQGETINQINEHSKRQTEQMAECYAQLNITIENLQRMIKDTRPLPPKERGW